MSEKPISNLRRRMLEDMAVRKFGEKTRHDYIRHVEAFARFFGRSPDTATAEDVRRFQVHLTESGVQPPTLNSSASALRFFFAITLDRAELARHVRGADVEVIDLKVIYANGQPDDIPVKRRLRAGERTQPLDLEGWQRSIERVDMVYRSDLNPLDIIGSATVCVEGLQ